MSKLPTKLVKVIQDNRDINYNPVYSSCIPIKEQNLKRETLSMIAVLDLNYWCESEEEKIKLKKKFSQNEVEYQKEIAEKYNVDNLFKNKSQGNEETKKQVSLIQHKERNSFQKILDRILELFKK